MTIDIFLFLVLALIAIATALGMLLSRNAVYSALFLVLNLVTVAVFFLLLGAPFIAMVQVTVYAGAIMVLFLFVIMLLGTDQIPHVQDWKKLIVPVLLAGALVAESVYLLALRARPGGEIAHPADSVNTMQAMRDLGDALFHQYLLPFEATSILLLAAMVGAIVLSKPEKTGK